MMFKTLLRIKDDVNYWLDGFYWLAVAFLFTLWAGWQFGWFGVWSFYCVVFTNPVILFAVFLWIVNEAYEVYYPKKISTVRMLREERRRADILEKEACFKNTYIKALKREIAQLKFRIIEKRKIAEQTSVGEMIYKPFSEYNDED